MADRPRTTRSAAVWVAITLPTVASGIGIALGLAMSWGAHADSEHGPIELAQLACWGLSVVLGLGVAWRVPDRATRWFAVWLGVGALLAGLRELDAHVYLNPEALGDWGVRYRLDWVTDGSVPLWLKLGWALFFGMVAFCVIYPVAQAKPLRSPSLRSRWGVIGLLVLSAAGLVTGWMIDDVFRFVAADIDGAYGEESAELLGAWCYASAVGLLVFASPGSTPSSTA